MQSMKEEKEQVANINGRKAELGKIERENNT